MRIKVALIAVVCLFMSATFAMSQGGNMAIPRMFGNFHPVVGAWSEYDVEELDTKTTSAMRMSIVGQEGELFWYEVMITDKDSRNIMKMLVSGMPGDMENSDNIKRLIIQSGDNKPNEMPMDFVVMGRKVAGQMFEKRSGVPAGASDLKVEDLGKETLTVPAGKFTGDKKRALNKEGQVLATYVVSDEVLPFGVVKSESAQSVMQLKAFGKDAKSMVTGEPVKMETPPGMIHGMPRGVPPGLGK